MLRNIIARVRAGEKIERQPKLPEISDAEFISVIDRAKKTLAKEDRENERRAHESEAAESLRPDLERLLAADIIELLKKEDSPQTRAADLAEFRKFAEHMEMSIRPASPELIAHYIIELVLRDKDIAQIKRHIEAIGHAHRLTGQWDPTGDILVRAMFNHLAKHGLKNSHGEKPNGKAH
jgi:hypothetical protein